MSRQYVTKKQVAALRNVLRATPRWRILVQDNPDPDALASAWALSFLAEKWGCEDCRIVFGGSIGRSENQAMCRHLKIRAEAVTERCFTGKCGVAIVDTQPGVGNNLLPEGFCPQVVIDHHPAKAECQAPVWFVRPQYGATATILTQYIQKAGLTPSPALATALTYGIKTDTRNLGRGVTRADVLAYNWLHDFFDPQLLAKIEYSSLPVAYFGDLVDAILNARIYNFLLVSMLGPVESPEMVAEMADFLLRTEGIRWTLCGGYCGGTLHLSLRVHEEDRNAGHVMQRIVAGHGSGGGHAQLAGAQVPVGNLTVGQLEAIVSDIVSKLLEILNIEQTNPVPLVPKERPTPPLSQGAAQPPPTPGAT